MHCWKRLGFLKPVKTGVASERPGTRKLPRQTNVVKYVFGHPDILTACRLFWTFETCCHVNKLRLRFAFPHSMFSKCKLQETMGQNESTRFVIWHLKNAFIHLFVQRKTVYTCYDLDFFTEQEFRNFRPCAIKVSFVISVWITWEKTTTYSLHQIHLQWIDFFPYIKEKDKV